MISITAISLTENAMDLADDPKRRKFFMPTIGFSNTEFLSNTTKPVSKSDKSHKKKLIIVASLAILLVVAASVAIPLIYLTQDGTTSTSYSKPFSKLTDLCPTAHSPCILFRPDVVD